MPSEKQPARSLMAQLRQKGDALRRGGKSADNHLQVGLLPNKGSLGRNYRFIRRILVPQALRLVIPPSVNDFIALFKDTSLVSVIAVVMVLVNLISGRKRL